MTFGGKDSMLYPLYKIGGIGEVKSHAPRSMKNSGTNIRYLSWRFDYGETI